MASTKHLGKNRISTLVSWVHEKLGTKVDKVSGKGLSTNDFTNDLKSKLEGLSTATPSSGGGLFEVLRPEQDYWLYVQDPSGTNVYGNVENLEHKLMKRGNEYLLSVSFKVTFKYDRGNEFQNVWLGFNETKNVISDFYTTVQVYSDFDTATGLPKGYPLNTLLAKLAQGSSNTIRFSSNATSYNAGSYYMAFSISFVTDEQEQVDDTDVPL